VLLNGLEEDSDREAVRVGEEALSYAELRSAAGAVAARVSGASRVAVWATNSLETVVAVVGALAAGVPIVPVSPKAGTRELEHILTDSAPDLVFGGDEVAVDLGASGDWPSHEPGDEAPAIIVYTSGTTGPPKGVVLPRRSLASNLDALSDAWDWTAEDVVAHGLPLFHVHGLILGVLGPLRLGGAVRHLGRFSSDGAGAALSSGATMLFGVPTMYHRLAADLEASSALAAAVGSARLLVSGSAALPAADHERISAASGLKPVERYGMSETLMNTAIRADGDRRPGTVGVPLDGV
jgi:malonyl-CoA/methylmalonyl-CoA synthetase